MEHIQSALAGDGDSFTDSLGDGDREHPSSNGRNKTTTDAASNGLMKRSLFIRRVAGRRVREKLLAQSFSLEVVCHSASQDIWQDQH